MKDLGTLQGTNRIRASGITPKVKNPSVSYFFASTAKQTLGVKFTDRTNQIAQARVRLFDNDTNKPVVGSGFGSLTNNVLTFRLPITAGDYTLKIIPKGSKQVKFTLVLSPGG